MVGKRLLNFVVHYFCIVSNEMCNVHVHLSIWVADEKTIIAHIQLQLFSSFKNIENETAITHCLYLKHLNNSW